MAPKYLPTIKRSIGKGVLPNFSTIFSFRPNFFKKCQKLLRLFEKNCHISNAVVLCYTLSSLSCQSAARSSLSSLVKGFDTANRHMRQCFWLVVSWSIDQSEVLIQSPWCDVLSSANILGPWRHKGLKKKVENINCVWDARAVWSWKRSLLKKLKTTFFQCGPGQTSGPSQKLIFEAFFRKK